jgi:hypothetical protein
MELSGREEHHISLKAAAALTAAHRNGPEGKAAGAVIGGCFGRGIVDEILAQPGCVGIRYYYGRNAAGAPVLVLVGVTADNQDMVNGTIAEEGYPCPPFCRDANPLNGEA